jgi:hypothetical protein
VANVNLSQRPVANDLSQLTDQSLPVAVLGISRDKEYGLAFYRNMPVSRYERGEVPVPEHLLVVPGNSQGDMARYIGDRPVLYLGHFLPQHIEYYRVAPRIGH